ncbi:MAG TPA: hypothetical protein VGG11_05845 [Xanthobacteraceae bacterium]|jgi:hypothetical protein
MTVDDLTTPLGRGPARRQREPFVSVPKVIAVALALFLGAFVIWAFVSDDPSGGEPKVAVPIDERGLAAANRPDAAGPRNATTATDGAPQTPANVKTVPPASQQTDLQQMRAALPPGSKTVTIIDGKTGQRHEVVIPPPNPESPSPAANSKGAKQ